MPATDRGKPLTYEEKDWNEDPLSRFNPEKSNRSTSHDPNPRYLQRWYQRQLPLMPTLYVRHDGLPKASTFTIFRLRQTGPHLEPPFGAKPGPQGDRWYICMPMYHGKGGLAHRPVYDQWCLSGGWREIFRLDLLARHP